MEEWLNYLGYIAGIFTTGSTIPQVIKTIRTREAGDVSVGMYLIYLSGTALWIVYGIIEKDGSIIIANAASGLLSIIMLILKFKYGKEDTKQPSAKPA